MTHVILDCDGVLLNWDTTFALWMFTTHNKRLDLDGPSKWDLGHWIGCDHKRAMGYVHEFNHSDEFAYIEACPRALIGIDNLVNAGHTLSVLTSCHDSVNVTANRKFNLQQKFGDVFTRVTCLALSESKIGMLSNMSRGIWVEDNYANATHGLDAGHDTFMVRRRHNAAMEKHSTPDITWMTDWAPVIERAANYGT